MSIRPIGRIDYLDTNGEVAEQSYYYDEELFLQRVKADNYCGVPMEVNVFRDEQGMTIPLDFMRDSDPPPQGFQIVEYREGEDMDEFDKLLKMAERYQALFPQGTRIELTDKGGTDSIPLNMRGTVDMVDDIGTVHCTLDNGKTIGLAPGEDHFYTLSPNQLLQEHHARLREMYIEKVNTEVIPTIEWVGLKNAYCYNDMTVPTELLRTLHEKFVETYGTDTVAENTGPVTVPGIIRAANGNCYVALMKLETNSFGTLWGMNFITPHGILSETSPDDKIRLAAQSYCPYRYWFMPKVEGDIHVKWENCPDTVKEMLDGAREPVEDQWITMG